MIERFLSIENGDDCEGGDATEGEKFSIHQNAQSANDSSIGPLNATKMKMDDPRGIPEGGKFRRSVRRSSARIRESSARRLQRLASMPGSYQKDTV